MASPVEVQYGITSYGGTNTSGTRVYASSVVAGNYSVVLVQSLGNPCSTGAVTDSQGNAYTLLTHDAANDDVAIWRALIASSGSLTVTYTIPGGGTTTEFAIAAVEVSVSGGTTLAKDTEAEGAGTSTSPSTGNLVTSTNTLMLALINVDLFQTPSAAGGFTQRATAAWPQRPASLIARSAAAGTYTPSWTMTGGAYVWRAAAIALKEVSTSTSVTGTTIAAGSTVSAPAITTSTSVTGTTIASTSTLHLPKVENLWRLIAQTGGYLNPDGGTSSAINTTGADLLVMSVPYYNNSFNLQTSHVSDSKGNTWFALTIHGSAGQAEHRFFYAKNPTVGSGHTFTINSSGSFIYPSPTYSAFSGADLTSPFDVENGSSGNNSSPQSTGSITPLVAGCLIVSAEAVGNATPGAVLPFMTTDTQLFGAFGYLEQGAAAAINPSWAWTGGSQGQGLSVAAFKPAGSATGITASFISSGSTIFPALAEVEIGGGVASVWMGSGGTIWIE